MDGIREKQLGALGLCAFSFPAIVFLPRTGWAAAGIVTAVTMAIATFGKPVTMETAGRGEKLLAIPLFLWNVLIMGKLGGELSGLYGSESPVPGLLLLLISGYAVKKGVLPVVGAVLVFFLTAILGLIDLFAIPAADMGKLSPLRNPEIGTLAYGFLPLLLLYMYRGGEKKKKVLWGIGASALALGAAVVTQGMGAPDFYTAAKSVNFFGAMERWEPLVAVAVTGAGFCLMGLLLEVNGEIWSGFRKENKNYPIELLVAVAAGMLLTAGRIGETFWLMGTTLCWGLIPILTQLVVFRKKD